MQKNIEMNIFTAGMRIASSIFKAFCSFILYAWRGAVYIIIPKKITWPPSLKPN